MFNLIEIKEEYIVRLIHQRRRRKKNEKYTSWKTFKRQTDRRVENKREGVRGKVRPNFFNSLDFNIIIFGTALKLS